MQYECLIATSYLKLRRLCPAQTPKQLCRDKSRNYGSKKAFGWSQARKWKPVLQSSSLRYGCVIPCACCCCLPCWCCCLQRLMWAVQGCPCRLLRETRRQKMRRCRKRIAEGHYMSGCRKQKHTRTQNHLQGYANMYAPWPVDDEMDHIGHGNKRTSIATMDSPASTTALTWLNALHATPAVTTNITNH